MQIPHTPPSVGARPFINFFFNAKCFFLIYICICVYEKAMSFVISAPILFHLEKTGFNG